MRKIIIVLIIINIFTLNTSIFSQTDNNEIRSMLWSRDKIQSDIDINIKPTLFKAFTNKEKYFSNSVQVSIVADKRIGRVRAIETMDKKAIEISTGFISLVSHLIDADIIANEFGYTNSLAKYYVAISDYLNQYDEHLAKGTILKSPDPFYKYVNMSGNTYQSFIRTQKYDFLFTSNLRSILGYILAHEYAHHIFGHLTVKKPKDLAESRANEDEADDFSIRTNWSLGNNPLLMARYFLLFTSAEEPPVLGTHTPSACRLEKFLHAGIVFTEPTLKSAIEHENLEKIKEGRRQLQEVCIKGDAMPSTTSPGLW